MALPAEYLRAKREAGRLWENGGSTPERFSELYEAALDSVTGHAHSKELMEGVLMFAPKGWSRTASQQVADQVLSGI